MIVQYLAYFSCPQMTECQQLLLDTSKFERMVGVHVRGQRQSFAHLAKYT